LRFVAHKGPPAAERVLAVPVGAVTVEATLPAGGRLLDALAALLEAYGAESAALTLSGGGFGPFAYVFPALSPDGAQVASYSGTHRLRGTVRLDVAAVTVGTRDGSPFFHCHALWTRADGTPGCGHVLPDDTVIADPVAVRGAGIVGARFVVTPDPETGFSLFMPHATGTEPPLDARPALAVRMAPNQDLIGALEQAGRRAGFRRAVVQGGVASINEARFMDAPPILGFATELLVRRGAIRCVAGAGKATEVEVAIVDHTGAIGAGCLIAGDNPVLMTFEGVLEAVG
jgi:predicted DNA-binding protein with PD1-like motif